MDELFSSCRIFAIIQKSRGSRGQEWLLYCLGRRRIILRLCLTAKDGKLKSKKACSRNLKLSLAVFLLCTFCVGGTADVYADPYTAGGGTATGEGSVAIGDEAKAKWEREDDTSPSVGGTLAVGYGAAAYRFEATALGSHSIAVTERATVLGGSAGALAKYASALGACAIAEGEASTVVGYRADAYSEYSVALGAKATVGNRSSGTKAMGGIAIGSFVWREAAPSVLSDYGIAIGTKASVASEAAGSVAIGYGASSTVSSGLALGDSASVTHAGSVAIGQQSATTEVNSVSVGASTSSTRTITNVTKGDSTKDAAIWDQIAKENQTLNLNSTETRDTIGTGTDAKEIKHNQIAANDGTVLATFTGMESVASDDYGFVSGADLYAEARQDISASANYISPTATVGANLNALAAAIGAKTSVNGLYQADDSVEQQMEKVGQKTIKSVTDAVSAGAADAQKAILTTYDGTEYSIEIAGQGRVASGDKRLVDGDTVYNYVNDVTSELSGDVTKIRADITAKDGKYVKEKQSAGENLNALDNAIGVVQKDGNVIKASLDEDGSLQTSISQNLEKIDEKIGTIEDGTYIAIDKDATISKNLQLIDGKLTNSAADMTHMKNVTKEANATADGANAIALGDNSNAGGSNAISFGTSAVASEENALAFGNKANASKVNTMAFGNRAAASAESAAALGNGSTASGKNAISFGTRAAASKTNALAFGNEANASEENTMAFGNGAEASAENAASFGNGAKASGKNAISFGTGAAASNENGLAFGNGANASGANAIAFGSGANASSVNAMAFGNGASVSGRNSVAIGSGSVAAEDNVVSVGSAGSERRITNVAAGVNDTDAVNMSQLHQSFDGLRMSLTHEVNKVAAGSAALAALRPEGYNPEDKFSMAVGFGHYRNANAGAVGAFYKPNYNTTISVGATFGDGDSLMNAGISFKFGSHAKGTEVDHKRMGKTDVPAAASMKSKADKDSITVQREREILRGFCTFILSNNVTNIAELYTYIEGEPDDVFDVFTKKSAFLARMCEANAQHPGAYKGPQREREILRGFCTFILTNNVTNIAELYTYIKGEPDDVFDVFTKKRAFLARMCEANAQHPGAYKGQMKGTNDGEEEDDLEEA